MRILALVLAVATGLLVLAGYFVPAMRGAQSILLQWAIILAGAATMVGILNLILVHSMRIHNREKGSGYSAILLLSLFAVFISGLLLGPDDPLMRSLVSTIVVPAESSLMALLVVSLVYGAIRLLRRRVDLMAVIFVLTSTVMLVASATLPFGEIGLLNSFVRPWLQHVLALGGARGLLIGVALGTLATGLRVLMGVDRPYEVG